MYLFSGCCISAGVTEEFALSFVALPQRVIVWHLHSSKDKCYPALERSEYVSEHLDSAAAMLFIKSALNEANIYHLIDAALQS